MNKEALAELTRQLAPIELPPAPDWSATICIAGTAVAIIALYILMRWLQRKARAYQGASPTDIRQLQQAWQDGRFDSRSCAYQLAALLRQQLGLSRLGPKPPAQLSAEQDKWQQTIQLLDQLRYQSDCPAELDAATFDHIQRWLTRPC